jgi:hypothetical protein
MYRIVGGRGTGKTYHLLKKANERQGTVICSNPQAMRAKARSWGFTDIKDFVDFKSIGSIENNSSVFIDELEQYIKEQFGGETPVCGYTYTFEEEEKYENN